MNDIDYTLAEPEPEDDSDPDAEDTADLLPPRTLQPPTADMDDTDLEQIEIDYPDYDPRTSYVVSGPLVGTPDAKPRNGRPPRGTPRTRAGARRWLREHFGTRFIRDVAHPMRWAGRVFRPGCEPK